MVENVTLKDRDIQYLAPEMINGQQHIAEQRCDIWSVGVIIIMMLTGQLPFNGASEEQLLKNMREDQRDLSED
jgi:calcium-dependent protein kinase